MNDQNKVLLEIIKDTEIKESINKYGLNPNQIEANIVPLYSYYQKKNTCLKCQGLQDCQQAISGHRPNLHYNGSRFIVDWEKCKYLIGHLNQQNKLSNLKLISCSFSIFDFTKMYASEARKEVLTKINEILENYRLKQSTKGLYIYGPYGSGKTYLLALLAYRIAELGAEVIFTYYPDLVRRLKSLIGSDELEEIINDLKTVEVLFLDDFGGETNTDYIRDEILGSILQARMTSNLLTFMSSNLNSELLREHLAYGSKKVDKVKASRIEERIRVLMDFINLNDQNRRK